MPIKPAHQREKEKREQKLAEINQQVEEGTLVIRKMTAAERKKWGPASDRPVRKKRR